MIDITGLDKAEVLLALYEGTGVMGLGVLQARSSLSLEDLRDVIENGKPRGGLFWPMEPWRIDYLFGKPVKVDLTGDSFDPGCYDLDAGEGAAEAVVTKLRSRSVTSGAVGMEAFHKTVARSTLPSSDPDSGD